ncbi:nucleotide-binding alpha-beta plait domain-containing protein [Tanacetum coccineum]
MGSYRSKEDDVSKIATSIFVTNFPESCSAKDLFQACKQYGHVVDAFIPTKRFKGGKRFGFVRFINVFNVERLVNNLCTVWVDQFKLHANIAKFNRESKRDNKTHEYKGVDTHRKDSIVPRYESSNKVNSNSYVQVAKGGGKIGEEVREPCPALVMDDECLYSKDVAKSLLCRVKEFLSLSNLKIALMKEGFNGIHIRYMGELWVLLEFDSCKTKDLFRSNVGVGSWFSVLQQAFIDFTVEGRCAWIEIEGVPFKLWSDNTFKKIANKWGDLLDVDDQEEFGFHSRRLCIHTKLQWNIFESFKIVYRGKVFWIRAKEVLGWTPDLMEEPDEEDISVEDFKGEDSVIHEVGSQGEESDVNEVPETLFEDLSGQKKTSSDDPFEIYRILNKQRKDNAQGKLVNESLKFPLGFTPDEEVEKVGQNIGNEESQVGGSEKIVNMEDSFNGPGNNSHNMGSKDNASRSVHSGRLKKSKVPRIGGSILGLLEEIVKVGQTIGYNIEGCVRDMTGIIESQGEAEVLR